RTVKQRCQNSDSALSHGDRVTVAEKHAPLLVKKERSESEARRRHFSGLIHRNAFSEFFWNFFDTPSQARFILPPSPSATLGQGHEPRKLTNDPGRRPSEGFVALSCSGQGRVSMKIMLPITAAAALIVSTRSGLDLFNRCWGALLERRSRER